MKELTELHNAVCRRLESFSLVEVLPYLKNVNQGSLKDVMDTTQSMYYQYLCCLMRELKPKQIVELGGAMGTSALCMLSQLKEDAKLYSITLEEHGLEFSFIKTEYPNLIKIVGDDLDLTNWPKELDFSKTDLMFVDSAHTKKQVQAELDLYLPLIGEGKLVLMDDIKLSPEMWEVWINIERPKLDVSMLHHSGFGMFLS